MKAAVFREYSQDPLKVVKIDDVDTPKIKPNEVMIKVEAAGFNYNDLWAIWGDPVKVPLPHISGSDVAGTVVEAGNEVTKLKVGDRVVSHSNMSCRVCDMCTSGREYNCNERLIWGFQTGPLWGGFCQYTHLPEVNVAKIPDSVSYEAAAAVSMVGMTAWHMLVGRAKIIPGQTVLVMGGTSGVGMAGIQIAKLYGCDVIATAGNKEKMDKCIELGAEHVVFEHIGKSTFPQEVGLLKMGGTLVATGATTGYDSTIDLRYLFFKGTNLLGSTQGTKAELEQVIHWTAKGKIKPLISIVLPFSDMAKGHTMMANAEQIGKIVTTPQKL
jgi:alcohol dehydrogenase